MWFTYKNCPWMIGSNTDWWLMYAVHATENDFLEYQMLSTVKNMDF